MFFFLVAVLRNSIKNTQTTCTTYPSSAKVPVPAAATSMLPSSLCTTSTAPPYCDYSASNYYDVPCEPRVNATSTRRDENYYPHNQQHHPRRLYPGNQKHYQQDYYDDDDGDHDYYVDNYRLTNNIRGTDSWTQFDNLLLNLKRMML